MKIVVGHLFPDYLNIYADRGNMAALSARAAWRGHELGGFRSEPGPRSSRRPRPLLPSGGGQDREQELIAAALADMGRRAAEAVARRRGRVSRSAVVTSSSGAFYRDQSGDELPGAGLASVHTSPASAG